MARMTIAPEHKKFFQIHGFIIFEQLVSAHEIKHLFDQLRKRRSELPGLTQENVFRALPDALGLARKLGAIAASLLDRKPIRLAYDGFLEDVYKLPEIQDREIGLLLSSSGKGLFFTDLSQLYKEKESCYFLIVFTANYMNSPIVSQ